MAAGLDLLLPPIALDGGDRPQSHGLGAAAWGHIRFLDDPVCDGCGAPFEYALGQAVRCAACQAAPRAFDRARAACVYDDHSRELILSFKHGDRTDLAGLFARWLSRSAGDLLGECDAVAPVPLHRSRLFRRRYNQAAEIARPLARMASVAYLPDALSRAKATASQGGKSGRGRRENVRGAFRVPRPERIAGRRILLVDDVLTTGATLNACAATLKKAGATVVLAAVIARVETGRSDFG